VRAPKKPKPARGEAWGILNPYGDLWTYETFESEDAVKAYVKRFWSDFPPSSRGDLTKFKPVRVRVTVSVLPEPKKEPNRG
jgi:hypothetical protein